MMSKRQPQADLDRGCAARRLLSCSACSRPASPGEAGAQLGFYRTAVGAEVDAVVEHGSRMTALEIKFSAAPKPARGFWQALEDLGVRQACVVAPAERAYRLAENVEVVPVGELGERLL